MATARNQQENIAPSQKSQNKLKHALKLLRELSEDEIDHAQDALRDTYYQTGEEIRELSQVAADKSQEIIDQVQDKIYAGKEQVEHRIEKNPWSAIAIAAVAGLTLGYFLGWQKDHSVN